MAAWLEKEHAVKVTPRGVQKRLTKQREEREEVARGVLADKLGKTIAADVDALAEVRQRQRAIADAARDAQNAGLELQALGEERKTIDTALKYGGGKPADAQLTGLGELLGLAFKP